ncbi:serine/threonine-protein kinase [Roseiconus lacunae]|uniref:serine/threonine-protein kinase n=1 Tax=Roseiconus lacunae TaxID=2605694 RepID=UPI001E485208|nr:serine/threonine-protein kinase [Roseiconus lacunae]MCD0461145.1 serine/threonine protein kinase [Roseiconus lacunae]
MTDPAQKNDADDETEFSVRDWRLEATAPCFYSEEETGDTVTSIRAKSLHDLAFAVALRDSRLITESQLAFVTRNWTAFGPVKLVEHLKQLSLLSEDQASEIEKLSVRFLNEADQEASSQNAKNYQDLNTRLIAALNPDGRLASILGLGGSSFIAFEQIEDRSVGSRYTLLRKIGQGGLGTVWLARDENLNRYVALKELTNGARAGDIALEHFRREAEITGRLEHPGIVPIHQFGHDEKSGKAFYVMRFLGRRTMSDAIDEFHERRQTGAEHKMLLHRLLSSFVSVCHSVGHAHSQKVIHRDLKPTNVALDEFGQVTLLDWGLSKVNDKTGLYEVAGRSEPGDLHDSSSASTGRVIGTPLYMAPEQAAGRLDEVDVSTDVYGLGGILYTILTGVGPHHATPEVTGSSIGREHFLARIVSNDVVAPKHRNSTVPAELDAICMKALSRARYQRYRSATELAEEVQRFMAGAPVHAYQAPIKSRVSHWMMRHPTLTQVLLLAVSLVIISLGAFVLTERGARVRLAASRLSSAIETTGDLEAKLESEARALERDLHFITDLPLMSAITVSQNANPHEGIETTNASDDQVEVLASSSPRPSDMPAFDHTIQTPEQWLDRQGELFDGFLNANPAYLAMVCYKQENENQLRELVRSERFSVGQQPRRFQTRLLKTTDSDSASPETRLLAQLRPGAALLGTNDQFSDDLSTNHHSPLVVSGIAAIYDPMGEFFGMNVIELDLGERLRELIPAIAPEYVNVIIADRSGDILLEYRSGRFLEVAENQTVRSRFPELTDPLNTVGSVSDADYRRSLFAKEIDLGQPYSHARFGVIAYVSQDD